MMPGIETILTIAVAISLMGNLIQLVAWDGLHHRVSALEDIPT